MAGVPLYSLYIRQLVSTTDFRLTKGQMNLMNKVTYLRWQACPGLDNRS